MSSQIYGTLIFPRKALHICPIFKDDPNWAENYEEVDLSHSFQEEGVKPSPDIVSLSGEAREGKYWEEEKQLYDNGIPFFRSSEQEYNQLPHHAIFLGKDSNVQEYAVIDGQPFILLSTLSLWRGLPPNEFVSTVFAYFNGLPSYEDFLNAADLWIESGLSEGE